MGEARPAGSAGKLAALEGVENRRKGGGIVEQSIQEDEEVGTTQNATKIIYYGNLLWTIASGSWPSDVAILGTSGGRRVNVRQ